MKHPIHILHIIDSLAPGGAERMLIDIANNTNSSRYRVSVCVTRSRVNLADELNQDIALLVLNRKRRFDLQGLRKFAITVNRESVDIFHAHGRSTFSFLAFARLLGLVSQPILLHDHIGIEIDDSIPWWFRTVGKKFVTHYVGVYPRLKLWAEKAGLPGERINVIDNAINLSRIENASGFNIKGDLGIRDQTLTGILTGGICKEKGLHILIEAVNRTDLGEVIFLIVGGIRDKAYYQACRNRIKALGLENRFIFLGERSDIPNILRSIDFAVCPSLSESGPLVLIEYFAAGLPFVATSIGGVSHKAIELGLPGFVEPDNPAIFSKALQELLSLSMVERTRRASIGKQIASEHFEIKRKMPYWYEIYAHCLQGVSRE